MAVQYIFLRTNLFERYVAGGSGLEPAAPGLKSDCMSAVNVFRTSCFRNNRVYLSLLTFE